MNDGKAEVAATSYDTDPYFHWYFRLDENGNTTRSAEDTPTTGQEQAFGAVPTIENYLNSNDDILRRNLPDISDLTLISGAIDTDIPIGHRAFRKKKNGLSRVLYHWDMGLQNSGLSPFGTDYIQNEIDDLLRAHSENNDPLKTLNERGFNEAIGAVDFQRMIGLRGLATRYAHGSHMLDVVSGSDPSDAKDELFGERVGIVTTTMPSRWVYGEAGEFLDLYMFHAVLRLYLVVKELRRKANNPDLPAVISLAFGRQAGSKREDMDAFSFLLKAIKDDTTAPFELVIPTGNDNLARVVACYELDKGTHVDLDWRLVPGDQTDNHLEIWCENEDETNLSAPRLAVGLSSAIDTDPPFAREIEAGHYWDAFKAKGKFGARVYRYTDKDPLGRQNTKRLGHLMSVGPVWPRGKSLAAVPSGVWKVRLENKSNQKVIVNLSIQTDQSILPVAGVSGRSYFEDEYYRSRDKQGRTIDAIKWRETEWVATDNINGTRRSGTLNTAASQKYSAVVSGYRNIDGMPALYSATGSGETSRPTRPAPSVALPTDDSNVLTGTLAAGASDGSKVAMRGTSFASSKAARLVAETWLHDEQTRSSDAKEILQNAAISNEATRAFQHPIEASGPAKLKLGHGRAPDPRPPKILRIKHV